MSGSRCIPLSPYDQTLGAGRPLVRALCYSHVPDLDRLNASLRSAMERFPRFATSLARTREGSLQLTELESLPEVELRPSIDWTPDLAGTGGLPDFLSGGPPDEPAFRATLTPVNGGSVLGLSLSHAAGDAHSFYLFLTHWSEQFEALAGARVADRTTDEMPASRSKLNGRAPDGSRTFRREPRTFGVLSFEQDFVGAIKAELACDRFVPTANEALTAFIVHRHASEIIDTTSAVRLRIPVNLRGLHPAIPRDFIGNAFLEAIAPLDDLNDSPSAARQTVLRIREAVARVRDREYVESVIEIHDDRIELKARDAPIFNRRTDIVSTSYTRMPLHELGFGVGPPSRCFCVFSAPTGFVILRSRGGLEAHVVSDAGPVSRAN